MNTTFLESTLNDRKIKPTAMRLLVLNELIQSKVALSLVELEKILDNADRITIYRALKKFEENNLIHSIEDGTGAIKYAIGELNCNCSVNYSHAHFHCHVCENTYCLKSILMPAVSLPKNFLVEEYSFVLKGICDKCKKPN